MNTTSEGNQIVDLNTLTDYIASALGRFVGNFASEGALPTKAQRPSLERNDYAYVTVMVVTSEGSEATVKYVYQRFKYVDDSSETGHWAFEYNVGDTAFTYKQWEAISSLWTEAQTRAALAHIVNTEIHVTSEDKVRWNAKQDALTASDGIKIENKVIKHTNSITAATKGIQDDSETTKDLRITYDAQGHLTAVTEFNTYPPITAGTNKQVWLSKGSARGNWKNTFLFKLYGEDAGGSESREDFRVITNL